MALCGEIFECQNEIKPLTRRMLDLKYQQSELDFLCAKPRPSQGDQIIVCYLPTVYV